MTLLELCDPLFQYICRINRSARKGACHDLTQVRAEVKGMLADLRARGAAQPNLSPHFRIKDREGKEYGIDLVLMFFVDFIIKSSPIGAGGDWSELAYEFKELAGDEKFFDLLDDTLADRSEQATERIVIFYTCMGLGFTGWYTGQPEFLRKKMMECAARIRGMIDIDQTARICPESYEHVDTSNLIEPPGASLMGIGIALLGLAIVLFVANVYLYRKSSSDLTDALKRISETSHANIDAASSPGAQ